MLIDAIPDIVELTYFGGYLAAGRHFAGIAYRNETKRLEDWNKRLRGNRMGYYMGSKPNPPSEALAGWFAALAWPLVYPGWGIKKVHDANQELEESFAAAVQRIVKAVFLGRAPRKERKALKEAQREQEREEMQARIKQLEAELEL